MTWGYHGGRKTVTNLQGRCHWFEPSSAHSFEAPSLMAGGFALLIPVGIRGSFCAHWSMSGLRGLTDCTSPAHPPRSQRTPVASAACGKVRAQSCLRKITMRGLEPSPQGSRRARWARGEAPTDRLRVRGGGGAAGQREAATSIAVRWWPRELPGRPAAARTGPASLLRVAAPSRRWTTESSS